MDGRFSVAEVNGQSGVFDAAAPTRTEIAANPNLRGHVRVVAGRRYLEYADGTPFLMLADTLWSMNTLRCGAEGPFEVWLRDRLKNGFNSVLTEFFEPEQPNEGGYAFEDNRDGRGTFDKLNPAFFTALDRRMERLREAGLVVAAHPTWVGKQHGMSAAGLLRVSRYLLARYGAYNLIWSLSGEYQYSYTNDRHPWTAANWRELGSSLRKADPYGHPMTIHPSGQQHRPGARWPVEAYSSSSGGEFHNESWLDHNWLQTGHAVESLWRVPYRTLENYRKNPVKPVILSEAFYEQHKSDGATAEHVRWQAWTAFLSGAAGYGYGAAGVWQFYDPEQAGGDGKDRRNSRPLHGTPWREALAYEGASQLRHVRTFLERLPWTRLEPCSERLRVSGSAHDVKNLTHPHCAAIAGESLVLYFPAAKERPRVAVRNGGEGSYTVEWFNPRTGAGSKGSAPLRRARMGPCCCRTLPMTTIGRCSSAGNKAIAYASLSRSAGSPKRRAARDGAMLFSSPVRTAPGPTSINRSTRSAR
jgi:hypothetical protein